jgi:hypothetical protein
MHEKRNKMENGREKSIKKKYVRKRGKLSSCSISVFDSKVIPTREH